MSGTSPEWCCGVWRRSSGTSLSYAGVHSSVDVPSVIDDGGCATGSSVGTYSVSSVAISASAPSFVVSGRPCC